MSDYITAVTDASFENEVINSDKPVIVDFWATWCGPCKMLSPVFEEVAKEYAGKVKFTKIDTDANQQTAVRLGVRSIPTLKLFKNGEEVATHIGLLSKSQLATFLDTNI